MDAAQSTSFDQSLALVRAHVNETAEMRVGGTNLTPVVG